jgi:hypothetical protein
MKAMQPLKIFKSLLYIAIAVCSLKGYASAQDIAPQKEKDLEGKMKQLELKIQNMQTKMDSIKANQRKVTSVVVDGQEVLTVNGFHSSSSTTSTAKGPAIAAVPNPRSITSVNINGKSFSPLNKIITSNFSMNYDAPDNKLAEKIKSGEVKLKIKTFSKAYNVSSGDKLQIDNRYGKVVVNTWNKNEFKVDVEIKAMANEDDDAQKLLDGVSITDSKDSWLVSFITHIDSQGNNSWGIWNSNGKSTVRKVEVNYTVYMPAKNALEITNRYGSTILPDFDGKLLINTSYGGGFSAKTLSNPDNDINIRYADVNIEAMNGGNLSCQYGNMVKIGTANNITLDTRYVSTDINRIKTAGNISVHYGAGLKIGDIDKSMKSLNISSSYAGVLIGLKKDNNFDFDVTTRYNTFTYNNDLVKVTTKSPGDDDRHFTSTKNYKGYVGKNNSDAKITITTNYQGVQFQ